MGTILVDDIIKQLRDVENADLWLDENFEKKLAAVGEAEAFVRPLPDLHSVAELLSHLIVWRRVNISRINGNTVNMPVEHPDNWKTNNQLKPIGWENLRKDFYKSQQEVIALLDGKDDAWLGTISTHYGKDFQYLLQGLIHHDFYHLGQLGITIKYLRH